MKIILLAIRTLLRFRLYTFINSIGLALSLGSCILIFRYVHSELQTDHFIEDLDRVCLLAREDEATRQSTLAGLLPSHGYKPNPLENPAVECYATIYQLPKDQITVNDKMYSVRTLATDSNYLKIIPLPILRAATKQLLRKSDEAAITESLAHLLFGAADPIGKTIQTSTGKTVTIAAILGKPDTRFTMPFDLLFSYEIDDYPNLIASRSLARLFPGNKPEQLNRDYKEFRKIYEGASRGRFYFYPLKKLYFDRHIIDFGDDWPKGNLTHLMILSAIALLILLIGLFNFVNIYTVLIMKRAREFGMKKVFGANSRQVALQLYAENQCMILFALLAAYVFVELGGRFASVSMGIEVPADAGFDWGVSLAVWLILPFITSVYPFIRYNYTTPVQSIRTIGKGGVSIAPRNIFLCLQYILTIVLVVVSLFSIRQLHYMLDTDPGFRTDNIITIPPVAAPVGGNMDQWAKYNSNTQMIKQSITAFPLFSAYTFNRPPMQISDYQSAFRLPGGEWKYARIQASTESYFRLLGLRLVDGRIWNDSIDSFQTFNVIINETAQKLFGITTLENTSLIADSHLVVFSGMDRGRTPSYQVIGIVKDFTTGHLSKAIPPLIFYHYTSSPQSGLIAQLVPGKKQEAVQLLKQKYNETFGDTFRYSFLEDQVKSLYDEDKRLVQVASFFAVIAILISSMGLFSLSLFDVQQRFHEISIRKVNGATTTVILRMLLRKYFKLLLIAFLIAAPISYLIITLYIQDFANKASISGWLFAVALLITGGISFVTLIYQTQKAARTNPAEIIRSE